MQIESNFALGISCPSHHKNFVNFFFILSLNKAEFKKIKLYVDVTIAKDLINAGN